MFGVMERNSASGGLPGAIFRSLILFFAFILAITVAGLYGVDLHNAAKVHAYADSKWVYAEVVAGLSAFTALMALLPFLHPHHTMPWNWILFILWVALFGVFGKIYIPANADGNAGVQRMKNAVWVDLINMLLWFVTAVYSTVIFLTRGRRTLHTGRAEI